MKIVINCYKFVQSVREYQLKSKIIFFKTGFWRLENCICTFLVSLWYFEIIDFKIFWVLKFISVGFIKLQTCFFFFIDFFKIIIPTTS